MKKGISMVRLLTAFVGLLVLLNAVPGFAANLQAGAWFGTNNSATYVGSNGSGGQPSTSSSTGAVVKTSGTANSLSNGVPDDYTSSNTGTKTFEVRPATNYSIGFIKTAVVSCSTWSNGSCTSYTAPATTAFTTPTTTVTNASLGYKSFDVAMNNNDVLYIWVNFTTSSSSFTVTGAVDSSTTCATGSSVSPVTQNVASNASASFSITPANGCVIDCITDFSVGSSCVAKAATVTSYTTGNVTYDMTVTFKFKPITYTITSSIISSPASSGTISPNPTAVVNKNSSQTFLITPATGYRILDVTVTENGTTVDKGPNITSYTFNNVSADGAISVQFATAASSIDAYCQIPAFVAGQSTLMPNVLILFDNSGSMGDAAYQGRKSPCDGTTTSYMSSCDYYGYFDINKMYNFSSSTYTINTSAGLNRAKVTTAVSSTVAWSGNQLNYQYMRKVDVIRKVLVGGKVDATKGVARGATGTKYLKMDNGSYTEYGPDDPTGIIQQMDGKVRFGLEVFVNSNGGKIVRKLDSTSGATATMVSAIESSATDPSTNTPTAEALYEAIRYYQAKPSAYNSGVNYGDTTWNDPANPIIQYACQKNFVIIISDGEPNSNDNLPGLSTQPTLNSYTDSDFNVTTWENKIPANDRADSTASTCNQVTFCSGSGCANPTNTEKVEAVAFYAHNTDLRSATFSNEILGTQNLTIYTVYSFGDGSGKKTLQMAAKYGGYNDTNANKTPDLQGEWNKKSDCIPDNYFEADDGAVMESSLMAALNDIIAKVSSGTAASVLSNSEGSGANMLQAVFYPSKSFATGQASWIGELQNLWYYVDPFLDNSSVREDTDYSTTSPDHIMDLTADNVVRFYFDQDKGTQVEIKQDVNGDGTGDVLVNSGDPDIVKSIWRAGKQLWARSPSTRNILTSINGTSLLTGKFTSTNKTTLKPYLQAADDTEADKIISYMRGTDQTGYRPRQVSLVTGGTVSEWKLGDIISSTPRIQSSYKLNSYSLATPAGYNDISYAAYTTTSNYLNQGMVYVGANDGMLHAFRLGTLTLYGDATLANGSTQTIQGSVKATLTGTGNNLGEEQWTYIPRNALPYLKFYTDSVNYKHLYFVDGSITLVDAAIGKPSGCAAAHPKDCVRDLTSGTNWRTVLIGSMGLGGAAKVKADTCTDGASGTCVKTPILDPADATKSLGFSSYFALDITNQYFSSSSGSLAGDPTLLWELTDPELGYSTTGTAIVKIKTTVDGTSTSSIDNTKNGRWFAVFASGPTGSIDTVAHQFKGKSDQNLKIFVVDLAATGTLTKNVNYWVLDTGIKRAFAGSIQGGVIDTERANRAVDGNYQDDVIYVGYTKANIADSAAIDGNTLWTQGGLVRILTKENLDPSTWSVSTVIDGIGPVTSGIAKIQDTRNRKLWIYFGTGRYYYSGDDVNVSQGRIFGISDPCYDAGNSTMNKSCSAAALGLSNLTNQTSSPSATLGTSNGWYINLDSEDTANSLSAERNITNPIALSNGTAMFTTFKPTSDVCKFGGNSYLWVVKYDTGGTAPLLALRGKALVQVSTGSFEEVDLKSALTSSSNRKSSSPMVGKPPGESPSVVSNASNKPAKKILHIQEK